jgi:hypothetical protein
MADSRSESGETKPSRKIKSEATTPPGAPANGRSDGKWEIEDELDGWGMGCDTGMRMKSRRF